jgi:uncharacterized repeat protein (TIGR01451 family)
MRSQMLLVALAGLVGWGVLSTAEAQNQTTRTGGPTGLVDRLDQFGKTIFGTNNTKPTGQRSNSMEPQPESFSDQPSRSPPQRAGNPVRSSRSDDDSDDDSDSGRVVARPRGNPSPSTLSLPDSRSTVRVQRPDSANSSVPSNMPSVEYPRSGFGPTAQPARVPTPARPPVEISQSSTPTAGGNAQAMRLHERMNAFRQSPFGEAEATANSGAQGRSAAVDSPKSGPVALEQPVVEKPATPVRQPEAVAARMSTQRTAPARRYVASGSTPVVEPAIDQPSQATPANEDEGAFKMTPSEREKSFSPTQPVLAPSTRPATAPPASSKPAVSSSASPTTRVKSATSSGSSAAAAGSSGASDNGAMLSNQSPILDVRTVGPRKIMVGKESTFEVTVRNIGEVAAEQVVVSINLPAWAEVVAAEPSQGTAEPDADDTQRRHLWNINRVEPRGEEKLALRIIPRQSKPIDLNVKWTFAPPASATVIEVQEPKLEMRLEGPREVLFGRKQVYRLELANTGTGDADAVQILLQPLVLGDSQPINYRVGTLAAGGSKTIEIELTPRQNGSLTVTVDAQGDGGVEAHLSEAIAVLRPNLQLSLETPPMQFVGSEIAGHVVLANTGNAAAANVIVTASLPLGAKYVSSTSNGQVSKNGNQVAWSVPNLAIGAREEFTFNCLVERAGTSKSGVTASGDGDLVAQAESNTQVEAMADLHLDVNDPNGPVPVGTDAIYQINIRNRGSKGAEDVDVIAYFSEGVDPVRAEGGPHKIAPGQVVFDRIPSLGMGKTVTFKIHAKASTPGNHVFRAEVVSKPLAVRLASEETTYYYGAATSAAASPVRPPANEMPNATLSPVPNSGPLSISSGIPAASTERTADRRGPIPEGVAPALPKIPLQ